jgi:uncharacterized membrane protein
VTPLVSLTLATLAFVGLHFLMSHPLRPALAGALGARRFLGLYSLVSLATLGWMILAYRRGNDFAPLWIAPFWWWPIASALMLAASILLVGSLAGNPALPNPTSGPIAIGDPKGVFVVTRHPINMSFMIWALVHASLAGSARNLIVAAGIFVLAWFGSFGQDARKARLIGDAWRDWQAKTSFLPFAALVQRRARWAFGAKGWAALVGGLVLWALATSWHAPVVSPIGDLARRMMHAD